MTWNSGALCCVSSETAFFVLKCDKDAIALYLEQGLNEEDGCEAAFEPIYEVMDFRMDMFTRSENFGDLNFCCWSGCRACQHRSMVGRLFRVCERK
jgi:hypothetical protein